MYKLYEKKKLLVRSQLRHLLTLRGLISFQPSGMPCHQCSIPKTVFILIKMSQPLDCLVGEVGDSFLNAVYKKRDFFGVKTSRRMPKGLI